MMAIVLMSKVMKKSLLLTVALLSVNGLSGHVYAVSSNSVVEKSEVSADNKKEAEDKAVDKSIATKDQVAEKALDALKDAKTDFMTDALDAHGSGFTWSELEADKRIAKIVDSAKIRKDIIKDLKELISKNAIDRAAIDEALHASSESKVSAFVMIKNATEDTVSKAEFSDFGFFSTAAEEAMSHEYALLGYFEEIPQGANSDKQYKVTWRLFHNAESPFERRLKYSATYRYGID